MKHITVTVTLIFACCFAGYGQLSIEQCQEKARSNYPQVQQFELVEKSKEYDLKNANKGYLPQFSISAKATYQSEVTEIPLGQLGIPGLDIGGASKDQYQITLDLNQTIWDGGAIRAQKNTTKYSTEVEKQRTEVDLYALRDRINQLYFGILLLDEQLKQNKLLQEEYQNNYDKTVAMKATGMSNQSDVDAVRVEQLKTLQREKELQSTLRTYREMLSVFIGEPISETTVFEKPEILFNKNLYNTNNRAELQLFDAQLNLYESQKKSINAQNMPKFSLFAQGGYGRPGLNMLKNEFSAYYIGGVRLNWNIGSLYTRGNSNKKIDIQMQNVEIQRSTFLFNTNLTKSQQLNEIEKMQEVILSDKEIIQLRKSIKEAAEVKVELGTLSTSDLIREINAENLAIQDKILHEMQLLINIENLKTTTNN